MRLYGVLAAVIQTARVIGETREPPVFGKVTHMHSVSALRDSFGRRFTYLRLSVTERCNFRCDYCLPNGYEGNEPQSLTLSEIRALVQAFALAGTRKIRITGGEPGLRKDLPEIIRICSETEGIEQVALTTNGYHLERSLDSWLEAGLNQLNVSIDSLNPVRFADITGHDRLPSVLRGIDKALDAGLPVKVNAVLMREFTQVDLTAFLSWIQDKPITVRFIELMQTGSQPVFFAEHRMRGEGLKLQLLEQGWLPKERSVHDGPALELTHPDYQGALGLILPYSPDFCSSCNRLRISAQGKLHLCLFGEQGYDLRPWMQSGSEEALLKELESRLALKHETHYLDQGKTGATRHFAMLGG